MNINTLSLGIPVKQQIFSALSISLALVALQPYAAAAAENEYFVEVGDDVRKEDAEAEWEALVARHKPLLNKLKLYPKDVLQSGQQVTTRLQAGPITTKAAALKICSKLFAKDVPCFVIEGVNDVPPAAMMHLDQGTKVAGDGKLPWLSARADVVPAPEVKGEEDWAKAAPVRPQVEEQPKAAAPKQAEAPKQSGPLPWLTEKKEAQAEAPREAKVQVAEAIRVPLTEVMTPDDEIRVRALPELKPSFGIRQLRDESAETGSVNSGAGWLDVGHFVNEEIASSMWNEVQMANRKQAKSLSMRITRPAAKGSEERITLSIGPFANSAEAYNFCRSGVQASERGLRCSFVANDPGLAAGQMLAMQNTRGDAYEQRRNERVRPKENPPVAAANEVAKLAPASGPAKQYWVQVVTADSQMSALKKWEQVKADNKQLIGDLRSSVSTSATDKSTYVVRVGPIPENDAAIRMCSQLQQRNVECRVLMYSRENI